MPSLKEILCCFFHDWGYWNCSDMDGADGENHPELGARIVRKYVGHGYYEELCRYHSRTYTEKLNKKYAITGIQIKPSKLCWADKLSVKYDPWFLYVPRAILSGEIKEYRKQASDNGYVPLSASHREWYAWARGRFIVIGNKGGKDGSYKKSDILT